MSLRVRVPFQFVEQPAWQVPLKIDKDRAPGHWRGRKVELPACRGLQPALWLWNALVQAKRRCPL